MVVVIQKGNVPKHLPFWYDGMFCLNDDYFQWDDYFLKFKWSDDDNCTVQYEDILSAISKYEKENKIKD